MRGDGCDEGNEMCQQRRYESEAEGWDEGEGEAEGG